MDDNMILPNCHMTHVFDANMNFHFWRQKWYFYLVHKGGSDLAGSFSTQNLLSQRFLYFENFTTFAQSGFVVYINCTAAIKTCLFWMPIFCSFLRTVILGH